MSVAEQINRLARELMLASGWDVAEGVDFRTTQSPRASHYFRLAEIAYEELMGDKPDYADDDDAELVQADPPRPSSYPFREESHLQRKGSR